jgi:AraC-like DNA-binding protein
VHPASAPTIMPAVANAAMESLARRRDFMVVLLDRGDRDTVPSKTRPASHFQPPGTVGYSNWLTGLASFGSSKVLRWLHCRRCGTGSMARKSSRTQATDLRRCLTGDKFTVGSAEMSAPSCSARILLPFKRYVDARRLDRDLVPRAFWSANTEGRVSLEAAQSMLDGAVERLGDQQLGLTLGRSMRFGEGGPFDYAVRSAPTLRDAVEVAARYTKLISDSLLIGFEVWRQHAVVRLNDISWTRPAAEFALAAFYKIHLSDDVPAASQLECWFPNSMPRDTSAYERSFGNAALKFNAPFFAFAFNRAYASAPVPGADSALHAVHCERVDSLLADLSAGRALKTQVRRLIELEIQYTRSATVPRVARALHMSRRTMSRRLEEEGTCFAQELDDIRRELALAYLDDGKLPLKEVAFRLGFSHVESFHRAFKRWTGEAPLGYRKRAPDD